MNQEDENEEMLYREMNPDDEFYMGDPSDKSYFDEPDKKLDTEHRSGCVGLLTLLLLPLTIWAIYKMF